MGLRRRVSTGFISIVGVLLLSGGVSFVELNNLSRDTNIILDVNSQYDKASREMELALRSHNRAFIHMIAFRRNELDTLYTSSLERLDSALVVAKRESIVPEVVDSMMLIAADLHTISQEYIDDYERYNGADSLIEMDVVVSQDSLGGSIMQKKMVSIDSLLGGRSYSHYMYDRYLPIYDEMLSAINIFVNESDKALAPSAEQLRNKAYRAVTPILISLSVMIVIVLMLYYFIMMTCVKPAVVINNSLRDYLAYKVPFKPKTPSRDELLELSEGIDLLIKQSSKVTKEE